MPVIRTQSAVEDLAAGERIEVVCTDPGAKNDIPAWCRINRHKVILIEDVDDEIRILIEVGSDE